MRLTTNRIRVFGLLALLFAGPYLNAQEFVEDFQLMSTRDKEVCLRDFNDQKAIVVVFTSSHCSWATKYEERLNELQQSLDGRGVAFIAINSNDPTMSKTDAAAYMRKASPFDFDYLKDAEQSVARSFGAARTPEAFVLIPQEGKFKVVYQGKIDDNPLDADLVKKQYLKSAIEAVLRGEEPDPASTSATGCNIKWIR